MKTSFSDVKNIIRYKTIDALLRTNTELLLNTNTGIIDLSSEKTTTLRIEDFVIECNKAYREYGIDGKVGRSWVFEDIAFLKDEAGPKAPIVTRRVNRVSDYYYSEPTFSLYTTEWFKQLALSSVERILDVFEPERIPNAELLLNLRSEILSLLSEYDNSKKIIYRSNDPLIKWHKWFDILYKAINNKQALEVTYQPFMGDSINSIISPQILKEFNRRYFLFALNENKAIRNFPLDRIKNIKQSKEKYISGGQDWEEYFDELVGVTKLDESKLSEVILRLPLKESLYFESKPIINGPIKINRHDDYYEFSFKVYPNLELENLIMSYLPNIKVIKPNSLMEKINERIKLLINI